VHDVDDAIVAEVHAAAAEYRQLLQRLADEDGLPKRGVVVPTRARASSHALRNAREAAAPRPNMPEPLREVAAERREALCGVELDAAPQESLWRLHRLWAVASEAAADEQLLSFAACAPLLPIERAKAMKIDNTAARMQYVVRALRRAAKMAAARIAVRAALA
jgi:hypothetical protein